jgi:hypothetical protein
MRTHFFLYLFLVVLMTSCSVTKQFYEPPHKNGNSNYDTSFLGDEYALKAINHSMFGLAIQDVFQRSLFDKLLVSHPSLFGLITGNNRIDITINEVAQSEFSHDYKTNLAEARKIKPDTFSAGYHTYMPRNLCFFYVLPKSDNENFVKREIDFNKYADSSRKYYRHGFLFPFDIYHIDSPLQVFKLPLLNTTSTVPFQPGGFLIAVQYVLFDDFIGKAYHTENRFIILNSQVANYERNVQAFFFQFFYSKKESRVKHFYKPNGFNQFIDSVNMPGFKGVNPYTRFVANEQLTASLEEFMHIVLYAEYGCREKPLFIKKRKNHIYQFKFYSEVKHSNMTVDFDLQKIKTLSVKQIV